MGHPDSSVPFSRLYLVTPVSEGCYRAVRPRSLLSERHTSNDPIAIVVQYPSYAYVGDYIAFRSIQDDHTLP